MNELEQMVVSDLLLRVNNQSGENEKFVSGYLTYMYLSEWIILEYSCAFYLFLDIIKNLIGKFQKTQSINIVIITKFN